jgi:quinol monooxygenase YgiN
MEQALKDAIIGIVPSVRQEPGCITYAAHTDRERSAVIVMYEIWADRAALDAHIAAPSFVALERRFDELLGEPLQIEHLVPLI